MKDVLIEESPEDTRKKSLFKLSIYHCEEVLYNFLFKKKNNDSLTKNYKENTFFPKDSENVISSIENQQKLQIENLEGDFIINGKITLDTNIHKTFDSINKMVHFGENLKNVKFLLIF